MTKLLSALSLTLLFVVLSPGCASLPERLSSFDESVRVPAVKEAETHQPKDSKEAEDIYFGLLDAIDKANNQTAPREVPGLSIFNRQLGAGGEEAIVAAADLVVKNSDVRKMAANYIKHPEAHSGDGARFVYLTLRVVSAAAKPANSAIAAQLLPSLTASYNHYSYNYLDYFQQAVTGFGAPAIPFIVAELAKPLGDSDPGGFKTSEKIFWLKALGSIPGADSNLKYLIQNNIGDVLGNKATRDTLLGISSQSMDSELRELSKTVAAQQGTRDRQVADHVAQNRASADKKDEKVASMAIEVVSSQYSEQQMQAAFKAASTNPAGADMYRFEWKYRVSDTLVRVFGNEVLATGFDSHDGQTFEVFEFDVDRNTNKIVGTNGTTSSAIQIGRLHPYR